ncbi:hypothetical protein G9A89_005935 [Geosiphon pyriformis]|nr:hypothetical protein G9A89_005935 [Geosiphon pyriformis]
MPKGRVSVGNVKYSRDKKDISLVKLNPGNSVYLDINSVSGNSKNDNFFFGVGNNSLFDSAANIPKAKKIITDLICGSPFGLIDYGMDKDNGPLFPSLKIFLDKKWVDPKIVKSQVEVFIRKFFVLDINFSAIEGKSVTAKTQFIRKFFSLVNGFGGTTTLSKFKRIIHSIFTSKENLKKAMLLAKNKGIIINNDLKKQEIHLNWVVIVKKIFIDMSKKMIIAALSEFGQVVSIQLQLIGL